MRGEIKQSKVRFAKPQIGTELSSATSKMLTKCIYLKAQCVGEESKKSLEHRDRTFAG